jgi:hypothetical protein
LSEGIAGIEPVFVGAEISNHPGGKDRFGPADCLVWSVVQNFRWLVCKLAVLVLGVAELVIIGRAQSGAVFSGEFQERQGAFVIAFFIISLSDELVDSERFFRSLRLSPWHCRRKLLCRNVFCAK